jgi:hypothetical protein
MGRDINPERAQVCLDGWYMELENGCRISNGKDGPNGYKRHGGTLAHRGAWVAVNGQIPDGLVIDHKCYTRTCVNPDHLRLLDRVQNNQRRSANGDDPALDACRWGHPHTMMRFRGSGGRIRRSCGGCMKERNDWLTVLTFYTRRLEIAYGLGDWHTKMSYPRAIRERNARIAALSSDVGGES